ncbi:unnamed protein product [Trypanosoma congolense IL3000]|uniref:WGS project CAEQ00000000 data, annotated contig 930 n=1 Tax=Trypanosoma congolense (strain IL3000) TaxID=1068625 RepID=F9WJM8_TRYCI|nr:unnamed protein product [Trypanosoma congolense IL3000]
MTCGAEWSIGELSQVKLIALEGWLHEDHLLFSLLQETPPALEERSAFKISAYQDVELAINPHGGGVSIAVRDGVGVEVGILEKEVPERATVTLRLSADVNQMIISAYFPQKDRCFQHIVETVGGCKRTSDYKSRGPLTSYVVGPLSPSDDEEECMVE